MSEIELHRKLLGDPVRNQAFHRALQASLSPGKTTVADLGAGTGFLSFLARRLGARHCTLIEYSDALGLARQLARSNGIDGLRFIEGHSGEIANPPQVDLVVSETLGNYALEEGLLETLVDARRYLKPGGRLIPGRLRQFVAPVSDPGVQAGIDIWGEVGFDLDFAAAREISLNNLYVKTLRPEQLGAEGCCWDDLDFGPEGPAPASRREHTVRWTPAAAMPVHGLGLWWDCELIPGVSLSTAPDAAPTHWEQVYLPLLAPILLAPGDGLEVTLCSDTRPEVGLRLQWRVARLRGGQRQAEQRLDSFKGRL
jgi:protein arginine N-methyltransferase 1